MDFVYVRWTTILRFNVPISDDVGLKARMIVCGVVVAFVAIVGLVVHVYLR